MTSTARTHADSIDHAAAGPASGGLGRVGAYDLMVEIASGGMATVFLARAPDGRLAAVKRPHPHLAKDPIYTSMLLDEARLASAIHHPNVARVRELGFEGDLPFIVMDYVEGSSLVELRRELADAGRALDVPIAARIILDALAGLSAAHALRDNTGRPLGIIHRDVSPHNVLVGSDGVARLTDFGIAKAEDRVQITRTHEVKGKLSYMAPERVDKRRLCTVQSDVFSMAVVLWECLAGRRMFKGDEPAHVLDAVLHAPIPRLRKVGALHVPEEIDQVIARALSRDLATRYQDAAEFAQALEATCRGSIGTHEDVARVIETVFAPRMRVLQESVRRVIGEDATEQVFLLSGLRVRPRPSPSMPLSTPEIFGAIGTEVPSDRYVIEELSEVPVAMPRRWPVVLSTALGVVVVLAVAIGGVLVFGARAHRSSDAAAAPVAPAAKLPRKVTVQLPFAVSRIVLDGEERAVVPPDDNLVFDVPADRDTRHRLLAFTEDGSSAEGSIVEEGGVARASMAGLTIVRAPPATPPSSVSASPSNAPRVRPPKRNVGTRRDGFTKLK